jgi:transcriptional regulator with XRE-family HTH domain
MRLHWIHIWRSPHYQRASAEERRLIEIRFVLARKVQDMRRRGRVSQVQLAERVGVAQSTISRVERASNRVSLDVAVRALINLGCPDVEIAATFDVSENAGVKLLRRRAERSRARAAGSADAPPAGEHRFLRKGTERLPRLR